MNNEILTDDNFILLCFKHYKNAHFTDTAVCIEDINRIKYIKKLITRYVESGDFKERLILNHLIILNNVFGPTFTCRILYLKLKDQMPQIKPFLQCLSILPDKLYNINNNNVIYTDQIPIDEFISNKLAEFKNVN